METPTDGGTEGTEPQDKGEGRGRGKWTAKGVQAQQSNDIEQLKSLVNEMAARLDALEGEGTV